MNNSTEKVKILSFLLVLFFSSISFAQTELKYSVTRTTNINYQSISSSGDVPIFTDNSTDDNTSEIINLSALGFNGFVYGGYYTLTGIRMCSNGYLNLDPSNTSSQYSNGSNWFNSSDKSLTIAPFFDDLLSSIDNGTQESIQKSFRYQALQE